MVDFKMLNNFRQISPTRLVGSEFFAVRSVVTFVTKDLGFVYVDSEDSDQTKLMSRLI